MTSPNNYPVLDKGQALMHRTGRDYIDDAVQNIDAGMFSGDGFIDPENAQMLIAYAERWIRQAQQNLEDYEEDEIDA